MDDLRVNRVNDAPIRPDGRYVLYWMTAARRASWNFALDRALDLGKELDRPIVVFEGLRRGHRWDSERLRSFVEAGMAENARRFERASIAYVPFIEPEPGAARGLLDRLAGDAAAIVTDEFPCYFLPRMVAATRFPVRLETVDGNGILPMRAADRDFPTAYSFRRFLQKTLPEFLEQRPRARLTKQDRRADVAVPGWRPQGRCRAKDTWRRFDLSRYPRTSSGLSPYLHFGQISAHQVLHDIRRKEDWTLGKPTGSRAGWWGMSESAEAFLDQLITWRELGFNMCFHRDDYDRYESLPAWARKTLEEHADDPREHVYSLEQFEAAETHDEVWNSAQRQLLDEGVIHNYLRMLWGKKILEWTAHPRDALDVMIELNNKYALDGRDPNSYSGIFWVLGRYDRAWGPERPVFGKIRYMSSENTARKLRSRFD